MRKVLETRIIIKGEDKTYKVDYLNHYGNKVYVTYKGNKTSYCYNAKDVEEKNVERLECDVFNYLKDLSDKLSFENKNKDNPYAGKEIKILKKYYDDFILEDDGSILLNYLEGFKVIHRKIAKPIIFPFGFNPHQKLACENALKSNVSIIDGPPGTGKTQTIMNIIANILIQNKTVAVISNNNTATDNIYQKFKKQGFEKLCATLGKTENIDAFSKNSARDSFPMEWKKQNEKELKNTLSNIFNRLESYLKMKNKVALLKEELEKTKLESKYYNKKEYKKIKINNNFNAKKILKINSYVDILGLNKVYLPSLSRNIIGITGIDKNVLTNPVNDISDNLNAVYYERRIKELEDEIYSINEKLEKNNFKELLELYTNKSMEILKSFIANNYFKTNEIPAKEIKKMKIFSLDYPIVLSTTYSLINCIKDGFKFDYIIVDEASQVDLVTAFLALSCGKNIVVVGDLKQLPTIVSKEMLKENNKIIKKYEVPKEWNYGYMNLLSTTIELFKKVPHTLLKEHYRCDPQIIQFCNERFYDNELIVLSENKGKNPMKIIRTTEGNHARKVATSWINERQANVIKDEVLKKENLGVLDEVGIISPYTKQCELITKKVDKQIECFTVHKFQGREKDVIIFATTGNQINSFINDPCLINVAISRAKNRFILVTHHDCENEKSLITDFILYAKYHNMEAIDSKISSVFDLLYKAKEKERDIFISTHRLVRKFLSENLIYYTLKSIINNENYPTIDFRCAYRLNDLIKDKSFLTEKELNFVNSNSHLDFCVYRKMDKKPILAIEVDGRQHLKQKQIVRDKLKDSILDKCGIPVLRLATHGDREKEKIEEKLKKILKY